MTPEIIAPGRAPVTEMPKDQELLEDSHDSVDSRIKESHLKNPFYPAGFDAMIERIRSVLGKEQDESSRV